MNIEEQLYNNSSFSIYQFGKKYCPMRFLMDVLIETLDVYRTVNHLLSKSSVFILIATDFPKSGL